MIKNYIWDFDGMLFDTYPHTVAVFLEILRRQGREADEKEVYEKFKVTMWHAFDFYGFHDPEQIQAFYALENEIDFPPVGRPFAGIPEILEYIVKNGGKNFLYTHRDQVAVEYLDRHALTPLFTGLVTAENNFPPKPAPDAIRYIIERYALKKEECMMLGDRDIDVGSGVNAGIRTALFDNENRYADVGQTYKCGSVEALFQMIRENLSA